MSLAQPPSYESVPNIMATRRLIASLNTWLEDSDPSAPRCDPQKLRWVAQQTIEELGPDASHESLLEQAKINWYDPGLPTEDETLGTLFREWLLTQREQDPNHNRRTMATVFTEIQRVMPYADQGLKLRALKGLWSADYRPSPRTAV